MRTFFAQVETRYQGFGGYMCFESDNDYRVWKNQK